MLRAQAEPERPNVLFLVVDDMKDWVSCLGGYEGTVHTPNIDRLAERGTLFTNAHCPSPKCAPSRAAVMTGLMPSTTGLYDNGHWLLPNLPDVVTIPAHFRANGYRAAGAGKIFHHTAGNHPPNQWDDFQRINFKNDGWMRGVKLNYPWSKVVPPPDGFPFSGIEGLGHENDWGDIGIPEVDYDDAHTVDYAVEFLESEQDKPFFLACGLFRPHLPWYAPQKYFDLYPLEEVVLPEVPVDDLDDVPEGGRELAAARRSDFEKIKTAGKWKEAVRAYLANISFADAMIGRVLDALDASPHAENTIVVLWSDHGWHLGEKLHWHKSTLWEEATRVPFVISAPGFEPARCESAVSLVSIFPTLIELCELPEIEGHDGPSLLPLLRNPEFLWQHSAVIEYKRGGVAIRNRHFRYIGYGGAEQELYDHRRDPYEWENLAKEFSGYGPALADYAIKLAKDWAWPAQTKSAFEFDPDTFTWLEKSTGRRIDGKASTPSLSK